MNVDHKVITVEVADTTAHITPAARDLLIHLRQMASPRNSVEQVFADVVEMMAIGMSNGHDRLQTPKREERYHNIASHYTEDELEQVPIMLKKLQAAMLANPFRDVLGHLFEVLNLADPDLDQTFNEPEIALHMAQMVMNDGLEKAIARNGYITMVDPWVGSGRNLYAAALEMHRRGYNPQTQLHMTGIDIDHRLVHMVYLQLSMMGIPAIIYRGDTWNGKEWQLFEVWQTPAHIDGQWNRRLRQDKPQEREFVWTQDNLQSYADRVRRERLHESIMSDVQTATGSPTGVHLARGSARAARRRLNRSGLDNV